jgi:hypothetical protein
LPDLSTALLAAIGYVINLATRNEDAHFHERSASGALRRMGLKAVTWVSVAVSLTPP